MPTFSACFVLVVAIALGACAPRDKGAESMAPAGPTKAGTEQTPADEVCPLLAPGLYRFSGTAASGQAGDRPWVMTLRTKTSGVFDILQVFDEATFGQVESEAGGRVQSTEFPDHFEVVTTDDRKVGSVERGLGRCALEINGQNFAFSAPSGSVAISGGQRVSGQLVERSAEPDPEVTVQHVSVIFIDDSDRGESIVKFLGGRDPFDPRFLAFERCRLREIGVPLRSVRIEGERGIGGEPARGVHLVFSYDARGPAIDRRLNGGQSLPTGPYTCDPDREFAAHPQPESMPNVMAACFSREAHDGKGSWIQWSTSYGVVVDAGLVDLEPEPDVWETDPACKSVAPTW